MKNIFYVSLLIISIPFVNALFFTSGIKINTRLDGPDRDVSVIANKMFLSEYLFFDNGVIRENKGMYGYLFGTLYVIYFKKKYVYIPEDVDVRKQYKSDLYGKARNFATISLKRIPGDEKGVIARTFYPGENEPVRYHRGEVKTDLALKR